MVAIKSIDGKEPPIEPLKYDITYSDLYSDSTGRSAETGEMLPYLIRSNICTINLEYQGTTEQIKELRKMIKGPSIEVVFLDDGEYVKKKMYPSDRSKITERLIDGGRYRLTFSLIEL